MRKKSDIIYSPEVEAALAGCVILDAGVTELCRDTLPEHFHDVRLGTV